MVETNTTVAPTAANATEEEKTVAVPEQEQSPVVEETFDEPENSELAFSRQWTLWEHYESQGPKMDYASSMCKACWFNDMISFSVAWANIPHSDLKDVFYDHEKGTVKM